MEAQRDEENNEDTAQTSSTKEHWTLLDTPLSIVHIGSMIIHLCKQTACKKLAQTQADNGNGLVLVYTSGVLTKNCDNFVSFFHNSVCINSIYLVVPLVARACTNCSLAFVV